MKKVFILLPDGVGLRNFAFGNFHDECLKKNLNIIYWNNTNFSLGELNYKEIKIDNGSSSFLTNLYKRARRIIELHQNYLKSGNENFKKYSRFKNYTSIKNIFKTLFVDVLVLIFNNDKGLIFLRKKIVSNERKSVYYKTVLKTLQIEKPDLVFVTNQRSSAAIAPIIAAKDLGIKTANFIFSWDNLPKATMVVETDFYFVWSKFMKNELLQYYPYINIKSIIVTGTPQFESHYKEDNLSPREVFFKEHKLDLKKEYICFTGDDVTTSPYDEYYLEDLTKEIIKLNSEGHNLGIIYRKCPVDFTERANKILNKYKNIIYPIDPKWKNLGSSWDNVMPQKEDLQLLSETLHNSLIVINIGSSIVFDAVIHDVPCAFINYNTEKVNTAIWDINTIYKYIHFNSMPSRETVLWVNKKEDYKNIIKDVLDKNTSLIDAKKWFNLITHPPQNTASKNIVSEIKKLLK